MRITRFSAPLKNLFSGLLLISLLSSCSEPTPPQTSLIYAFGTMIELTIQGVDKQTLENAQTAINEDFSRMHKEWHAWENGPLGRVNTSIATDQAINTPASVLPLLTRGKTLAEQSQHLFNPAIGKLIALWGFHGDPNKPRTPPEQEKIAALLKANPRMSDLQLDGNKLTSTNPNVKLDFGAFGKGYGIDLAITHLQELGVKNAIINAGGDLRAIGSRADQPWRIAVRDPSGEGVFALLEVSGNESVFTSGDYERKFEHQGKTYHHIIDPRSGYPAQGTQSVTVIHPNATTADAASTALFVAGPEGWYDIATSMGIHYVLLIDKNNVVHMNPAMAERIQLVNEDANIQLSKPLQTPSIPPQ